MENKTAKTTDEAPPGSLKRVVRPTADDALEAWMREVTDLLCYQPDVPMDHKTSLVNAFGEYRKAIGRPLRE